MDRFIYTALTGANAAMDRQRMVANNLANSSTPGFRKEVFAVKPSVLRDGSLEARAPARGNVRGADLAPARVNPTGNPMDVAVQGEALIAFQAPDGNGAEVYSRRGDLRISSTGLLENGDGLAVLGEGGVPITVPQGFPVSISGDGTVLAADPNAPSAQPQQVGRIKLVSTEGSSLIKGIDTFMKVPGGGVLPPDPTARVTAGSLEQSNVETAETLVAMIEAQRSFEQRMQVMSKAGELDESSVRLMSLR